MTIIITIKIEETEELHRRTGSCYKHSISAADSTTRDSSYIKEGFRYRVSFMKTGVGEEKKIWERERGGKGFQKLNR